MRRRRAVRLVDTLGDVAVRGRLVAVLLVVAGVLGMHALAPVGALEASPPAATATPAIHDAHADHGPGGHHPVAVAPPAEPTGHDGHAGVHGGLAGWCLAVLTLVVLLLASPRGARGWPAERLPYAARRLRPAYASRGAAPPDLHALSVLRC